MKKIRVCFLIFLFLLCHNYCNSEPMPLTDEGVKKLDESFAKFGTSLKPLHSGATIGQRAKHYVDGIRICFNGAGYSLDETLIQIDRGLMQNGVAYFKDAPSQKAVNTLVFLIQQLCKWNKEVPIKKYLSVEASKILLNFCNGLDQINKEKSEIQIRPMGPRSSNELG